MEGLAGIKADIQEIKTALLGSPLSPSSVITRLKEAELKIDALEAKEIKNELYFKMLIFVSGLVVVRIAQLIFNYYEIK